MKQIFIILFTLCLGKSALAQEKHDQVWIIDNNIVGASMITWQKDTHTIEPQKTKLDIISSVTSICDAHGKLKYYSNGCRIMGSNHKVIPNGDTLSPGEIYNSYCAFDGFYPSRNCVTMLPKPGDTSSYYVFHVGMNKEIPFDTSSFQERYLYYTVIDSRLNNGIGAVTQKNTLIVQDTFLGTGVRAIRHANGKDWWVVIPENYSLAFQKALLTANGVIYKGRQQLKGKVPTVSTSKGGSAVAPNGKKYAFGDLGNGIYIFDFDNCTGQFSNPTFIDIGYKQVDVVGLEFSPNSRFLYVSLWDTLKQYDMHAKDIVKSGVIVDTVDIFLPNNQGFYSMALAPNGKIYITGTNSGSWHTIHQPDLLGKACRFKQIDFKLPALMFVAMPNLPKYRGNLIDENCKEWMGTKEAELQEIKIYPNPASNQITIKNQAFDYSPSTFALFDIQGRQVFTKTLQQEKENIALNLPNGIYFWRIFDENRQIGQGKLILIE